MSFRKILTYYILPFLSLVFVCAYPCAFLYLQNVNEAFLMDVLPFFAIFLGTGVVIGAGCLLFLRNFAASALMADLCMLVITNGNLIISNIKARWPWFLIRYQLLLMFLLLLAVFILLFVKRKKWNCRPFAGIVAAVFGGLILVNVLTALPAMFTTASTSVSTAALSEEAASIHFTSDERPNVYYLIYDEYGGFENLEHLFDYDNGEFRQFLEEEGFNINVSGINSESCWTVTLMPNLLNLNYVFTEVPETSLQIQYLDNPFLFQIFSNNGYRINVINHMDYIGHTGTNQLTENQTRDNIATYLYENSLYSLIPATGDLYDALHWSDYYRGYVDRLQNCLEAQQTMCEAAQGQPTLTVSYMQFPHWPYVFNADGSVRPDGEVHFIRDFYLSQLEYANTTIESAVRQIKEEDPDAMIIIQSDHGSRFPFQQYEAYGIDYDPVVETPYMQNKLDVVYYKGQTFDIEGLTGINTIRYMLNEVFGTELELLEAPTGYLFYSDNPGSYDYDALFESISTEGKAGKDKAGDTKDITRKGLTQ